MIKKYNIYKDSHRKIRQKASEDSVTAPISKATQMSSLMQELAEMARGALNAVNAKCRTRQRTRWPKKK